MTFSSVNLTLNYELNFMQQKIEFMNSVRNCNFILGLRSIIREFFRSVTGVVTQMLPDLPVANVSDRSLRSGNWPLKVSFHSSISLHALSLRRGT